MNTRGAWVKKNSVLASLLMTFCAACDAPQESGEPTYRPPIVLQAISGDVLIGLSNSSDGGFHFWTFDLSSGAFEICASGIRDQGGYPGLIPGVTPSRLIWYEAKYTDDGYVDRFESVMVEPGGGGPTTMDFIRTDPSVTSSGSLMTSRGLFADGKNLLVHEGDSPSKYWWWDLSTKASPSHVAVPETTFPAVVAPATGIAPANIVIAELSIPGSDPRWSLVLLDTKPLKRIGALGTNMDILAVFDGAPDNCVIAVLRDQEGGLALVRLTRENWDIGGEINPAMYTVLPNIYDTNVTWAAGIAFWISQSHEVEGWKLNMARYTETDRSLTIENYIPIVRPDIPRAAPQYRVSSDAKTIVTCDSTNTIEVRRLDYPNAELVMRCIIEESRVGEKVVLNLRKL